MKPGTGTPPAALAALGIGALAAVGIAALVALGIAALVAPLALRDELVLEPFVPGVRLLTPSALFLVALLPILFVVRSLGSVRRHPAVERVSLALRVSVVLALAVALAEPTHVELRSRKTVVFAVDGSASIGAAARQRALRFVRDAARARGSHEVALVTFAREARTVPIDSAGNATLPEPRGRLATETDVAAGLRLARALVAPGTVGRVVVLSDGLETLGDSVAEAARAHAMGIDVDTAFLDDGIPNDVAVRGLVLPEPIEIGAPFELVVRLHATRPAHVRLRIDQGAHRNALEPFRELDLPRGDLDVRIRSVARVPGPLGYRVTLEADHADDLPENDSAGTVTNVPGRPVVLIAEGVRGREVHLARALSAAEFEVETRTPRALPTTRAELSRFAFVVLSDASSDEVTGAQVEALASWVREDGGALLAAGGDRAFGLGGWQGSALERLLPIRMDPERRRDQPTLALTLVLDRSGSMAGAKLELAKEAARAAAGMLGSEDAIEVIGFDAEPERVVRMQSAGNRLAILRDIGRMAGAGGTMIFPALDLAYQDLGVTRARLKHVILLTDGQSPEDGLTELVQLMRADGMTVSTVGLGADVNRSLLAQLAELGGGRSYFTNDPTQVPRIFVRETATVAQSAVVEEPFVPRVRGSAGFLRGVDFVNAPPLYGYVATRAKPSPAEVLLESPTGEPILARWRVGSGWALAWTSDVKSRWAAEWVAWEGYSRLFAQLVREHLHRDETVRLPMTATLEGEEVRVVVDALDGRDRFMERLDSRVTVSRADGDRSSIPAEPIRLVPVAPGRYEARFPLDVYGSFLIEATHTRDGVAFATSVATLQHSFPGEFERVEPSPDLLDAVARAGGGRRLSLETPTRVFRADGRRVRANEPRFASVLGIALVLLVLDVAVRRLTPERSAV